MDDGRTSTNGPKEKKIIKTKNKWRCIRIYIREMTPANYVSRKEGRKGLASIEDIVNASIKGFEDYLRETKDNGDQKRHNQHKNQQNKNNYETGMGTPPHCMDISSDKLTKSHTRRPGRGEERKTLREKLNLSTK